jgi:hypothetical protein
MSCPTKDALKVTSSAQEDLSEASIDDMLPDELVVVLLAGTPGTTPEKKNTLPSSSTPCVNLRKSPSMSCPPKDALKASTSAQEDLGQASIDDMLPEDPVVVLLPGTPAITPEKKKKTLPSSSTPCVQFSSQRLHQLASVRRYLCHSLDERELQLATNRESTGSPLVASGPQSPLPASSMTNEDTRRGPDMVALKRLGERRERLGRLRRQQSAPDPRLSSTRNEQKLSGTAQSHAVKDDAKDAPTPSGPFLPLPNKNDDFKTAYTITNDSLTKTPCKSNRFDVERCQELQAHRAKYHYGGAVESHMQAKVKKIESLSLAPSPKARQWLVELGRTRPTTTSPFALQSPTSFGYPRANSPKKSAECSSPLLHLTHLMNGTKPADEDYRGSKVSPSHKIGRDFEDLAIASSSVSSSSVCSVPSQRRGRSRLFLLACLAVGSMMIMRSGLWAWRAIYNSHFCPGASDSGHRSCVRPNRRIRDKQAIATPRGSENIHSDEGYAQGTPRSLGRSLRDRIESSYVKESLPRLAMVPKAVPEKESTSSRSKESRPKSSSRRRSSRSKSVMDQNLFWKSWNATSQVESYDFESVLSRSAYKVSLPCRNRVNISSRIVPQRFAYRKMQAWTAASFANEIALQCSDDQDESALSMWGGFCPAQLHDGTLNADMVSQQTDRDLQNTTSSEEQPECTFVPSGMESGFSRDDMICFHTPWISDGVFQVNTDFPRQASAQYVIQSAMDTCEKRVDEHPPANIIFTRFGKFLRKQHARVDQMLHLLRTIEMEKVEALLQI